MMFKTTKPTAESLNNRQYDTTIYSEMRITGELKISGSIYIDGKIKGNVSPGGAKAKDHIVVIGPNATIAGNVSAAEVHIMGKVEGNIYSEGIIFLLPGSIVHGDIHYNAIDMSHGAKVNGRFNHLINKDNRNTKESDADEGALSLDKAKSA